MKHAFELFEQPIPQLRRPTARDESRLSRIERDVARSGAGAGIGGMACTGALRDTSVLAEVDGEIAGFVSAYLLPYDAETLFVWRVEAPGADRIPGLGSLMIGHLMRQDICRHVTRVQTVLTQDDAPGWALFRRFSRWQGTTMRIQPFITQALEPMKRHEAESLITIRANNSQDRIAA